MTGDALLAPTGMRSAQRFVLAEPSLSGMTVLSGRVTATVTTVGAPISFAINTSGAWVEVGPASTYALTAAQASSVLSQGLRLVPSASTPTKFSTNYVEARFRYQVTP